MMQGKYFLVVEMASQLYRSLAPIQPWLSYLLDGYVGPKKVLGVILSATYMVCKGPDIVTRMKSFHQAIDKFIHSVVSTVFFLFIYLFIYVALHIFFFFLSASSCCFT